MMLTAELDAALTSLAGCWPRRWPGCDPRAAAAEVTRRLAAALAAHQLADPRPLDGGVAGLIVSADSPYGPVVVKLSPRVPGSESLTCEARALAFWQPTDAVAPLRAVRDDGYTLVLDRLKPGIDLHSARRPTARMLQTLGELARRLHDAGAPPSGFSRLRDTPAAAAWRAHLEPDPGLRAELDRLLTSTQEDRLVHGDLHARNALQHQNRYLLIGPHPVVADRHAEIQPLLEASLAMREDVSDDAALARGWVAAYAQAAGLDEARTGAWTRVRARAEALAIDGREQRSAAEDDRAYGLHRLADALSLVRLGEPW